MELVSVFSNKDDAQMMSYDDFRTYMVQSISKIFAGSKFEVVAEMSKKHMVEAGVGHYEIINLKEKVGEVVHHNGFSIADCYEEYVSGRPIGDIVFDRVKIVERGDDWFNKIDLTQIKKFEEFKDKVIFRPLRYATNRKILGDFMYRLHGDIALVIYMLVNSLGDDFATAKIQKSSIESWNLPDDKVFDHAISNTAKLFEPYLLPMDFALTGVAPAAYPDKNKYFMRQGYSHDVCMSGAYVLFTNDSPNAAAAIFYPGVPERLASILQDDFYVAMPFMSWVVVHAKKSISLDDIREMVDRMKNSPHEDPKDFLTDNVFYYSRKHDVLKMV